MAHSNVVELSACLADCRTFCDANPDAEPAQIHGGRLRAAQQSFESAFDTTDRRFVRWQGERLGDHTAWKDVSNEHRNLQRQLRALDAVGYPTRRVRQSDRAILEREANAMVAFLSEHADSFEDGQAWAEKLGRLLEAANEAEEDADESAADYQRFAQLRASALGSLNSTLGEFRRSMRRYFGVDSAPYTDIRWARSVASDDSVL